METQKKNYKYLPLSAFLFCALLVTFFAKVNVHAALITSNTLSGSPATSTTSNTATAISPTTTTATTAPTASSNVKVSPEDSAGAAVTTAGLILNGTAGTSSSDTTTKTTTQTAPKAAVTTPTTTVQSMDTSVESKVITEPVEENKIQQANLDTDNAITNVSSGQVFAQPAVIKATELKQENNPKFWGVETQDMTVEKVEMIDKYGGEKSLLFKGKSAPNSTFNIFIFSDDPIVMTIKADEAGGWSYELTKDLVDGQHEVYVAVTEKSGRILTKAAPIAFVKTAQAATMIPLSQLDQNKSPMQRSTSSYILVAIVIMSVFLAIALVLIGILNHKYKADETTY